MMHSAKGTAMCDQCETGRLNRRQFLAASLAGAGIAAGSMLAGCSTRPAASQSSSTAAANLSLTPDVKDATEITIETNSTWYDVLDFNDSSEFENATRNLIAAPDSLEITDENGTVVWSQKAYEFAASSAAPDTANPSLWSNTLNNHAYGLFKVVDRIYQIRGYDMSNLTLVQGDAGWIVFDTLMSVECSKAALALANETLGERPVSAVIISHTHIDHYGGIKGVMSEDQAANAATPIEEQIASDKIPIIVPPGFTEHVVSENLFAGAAMGRRAAYQYGAYLPKGTKGALAMGIGNGQSTGTTSFIAPSYEVPSTGTELTIDGVKMEFQLTPGTEAPAEMNTWLPDFKALWMAENCTGTMHNLYTLRGAQVRDGNAWANYITQAVARYGSQVEVTFQSHNWPHWGNATVNDYLVNTAAVYKHINDQTLEYLNDGYTETEIARMVKLPALLAKNWYTRQYYGTVHHNVKATYQRYMGWYDANPIHLAELEPAEYAKKLVSYLGDANAVLGRAMQDFENGEYQWVAQITNALVFADPSNQQARLLCADALEQLGYQTESGTWRNCYLTGALELREGNYAEKITYDSDSADARGQMSADMVWDYLGIRLDKDALDERDIKVNANVTDTNQEFLLRFKNGPLLHFEGMQADDAVITLTGPKEGMLALMGGSVDDLKKAVQVEGDEKVLAEIMASFDPPKGVATFNIIEP